MQAHDPRIFVTQCAFRALMDALARPGRIFRVPTLPGAQLANPFLECIVRTLLDRHCGFAVASCASDGGAQLAGHVAAHVGLTTSAARVAPDRASFALLTADVPRAEQAALIAALTGGTALSPERGATALVECRRLSDAAERQRASGDVGRQRPHDGAEGFLWEVAGPGVRSHQLFASSEDGWFAGRLRRHDEFPCGIDLLLVDRQGNLVGLPRTARIKAGVCALQGEGGGDASGAAVPAGVGPGGASTAAASAGARALQGEG
ncbi:MAG: phosphonate C-P lyase system protein PhnH [Coriobacteriales bacterium]|nr:phosphonate C-P lyase system protein PhnH [Coriobacteriales bacterium]